MTSSLRTLMASALLLGLATANAATQTHTATFKGAGATGKPAGHFGGSQQVLDNASDLTDPSRLYEAIGELFVKMKKKDVVGAEILVRKTKVRRGGEKYRVVPKPAYLSNLIDRLLPLMNRQMNEYLFQAKRGGGKLTREGANWRIKHILGEYETGQIPTCHTLRKTVATRLVTCSNNNILIAQKHLGHKSIATTAAYLDNSRATYVQAVNDHLR